jgi:tetratricopeptide (TPR) repeat protein
VTVEAEVSILMGQLVWDASQRRSHGQARAYLDRAAAAGREMRNPIAEGLALLRSTIIALYGERTPDSALDLAYRCVAVTEGSSNVLAGLATLHAAEAHAIQRQQRECDELLGQAETLFGQVDASDEALHLYSPGHFPRMAGSCFLFLNRPKAAENLLERAIARPQDPSKSDAIVLGNLALAHIRQRRPDEAGHAFDQALDVVTRTWGGGGITMAFQVSRELQSWRHVPTIQDACERLLDVMASAGQASP